MSDHEMVNLDEMGNMKTSMEALQEQLQYYEKGTTVTLKIQIPQTNGEYKEQTIEVTLQ